MDQTGTSFFVLTPLEEEALAHSWKQIKVPFLTILEEPVPSRESIHLIVNATFSLLGGCVFIC